MSIISPAPVTGTLPAVSPLSYPFAYVSTPPLPGSPFELPPMLERIKQLPHPPSPTSPHLMSVSSDEGYYHPASSCGRPLPAFLEPVPLLGLCSYESSFRPDFFPALKERHRHSLPSSLPLSLVHPPSPLKRDRRATIPGILQSNSLQHVRKLSFPHKIPAFQMSGSRRSMHTLPILPRPDPSSSEKEHGAQMTSPISPTMAAATATATATCALGTHTALQPQVKTPAASDTEMDTLDLRDHRQKPQTAFDRVSFTIHSMSKPQMGLDQSMFLTKNAHIKRPRNAWIHVGVL
ncbi:hypothetical protein BDF14DRAFT_1826053 [Spinellus fusiger]|nr:hypothetical protein BDF14DRAFT_1826053 [Spinellus fusiger]